ncbi:MAG TPA: malto-oligosyltrehalose synthase [Bryobacteraceae bacterium]
MRVPQSTYRLQLHAGFDFDAASAIVEYLSDLGISHVYCSPSLQAAPGSTHGYDIVDYHRVNKELGGAPSRARFAEKLRSRGMGQVLDIVPNHMAITGHHNKWWWNTLENGASSRYAPYFDIEWNAIEERLRNKILLPVLEDHSGLMIEARKLALERSGGSFLFRYYDHTFPVAPESVAEFLGKCASICENSELAFLADSLAHLPTPAESDWAGLIVRHRNKEVLRELLLRLCDEHPEVAECIDKAVEELNGNPDELDALLLQQNYRLARWRSAAHDLAYRRFFDINTLVGMRVEDERVFADTHRLILDWLRSGELDGVRVDHPDGLRDPEEYFHRLRAAAPEAWIVAEKILQPGEALPESWKIAGTTGYDFLNLAGGLFVDPRGEAPLNDIYQAFTGERANFAAVAREKKDLVLREILDSDVSRLTDLLVRICEHRRDSRDYTRHELHETVREVIAWFPVYRSYARAEARTISPASVVAISEAVNAARSARPDLDQRMFDLLGKILALEATGDLENEFVMRFQQLTAAAMAKGVEDTAFYCYLRLVSLNEVGGDPKRFRVAPEEFHRWCQDAQSHFPSTMLATSTHDTKRSEDVRSRIGLLSEIPLDWGAAVMRWSATNAGHRSGDLPDRKTEYLLYQTMVGAWPLSRERLVEYSRKAVREAKEHTSWIEPNTAFEEALAKFIEGMLADRDFLDDFQQFLGPLMEPARLTSLSLTLLKLTAPGVPDLYQGSELWDLSLVDPDNRRPVDYELRRRLLSQMDELSPEQILARSCQGLPKLWTVRQALRTRNAHPESFGPQGAYQALWAAGPKAANLVSFRRGQDVIAAAPRLLMTLGNWAETSLEIPEGRWKNQFTGDVVEGGKTEVSALLRRFPVLLLVKEAAA